MNSIKSKTKSLSKTKSKTKTKSKSLSKGRINQNQNIDITIIPKEHDETEAMYQMRLQFIKKLIESGKVEAKMKNLPYLTTFSFIHLYKNILKVKYSEPIEKEYQDLIK